MRAESRVVFRGAPRAGVLDAVVDGRERRDRTRARRRGQSIVELALVLPVALSLLMIITDVGRLFTTYVGVRNAAREGAAYGMSHPTCWADGIGANQCPDPGNITYVARQEVAGDTMLSVIVACVSVCTTSTSLSGNSVTVATSRVFNFIFPAIPSMTIGASATAVIQ